MALNLEWNGDDYAIDLDDMTVAQARAMEGLGLPNIKSLEEGMIEGDLDALTFCYWLMLVQNGSPGQRLDRVEKLPEFKPHKFALKIAAGMYLQLKELEAKIKAEIDDPKDEQEQAAESQ